MSQNQERFSQSVSAILGCAPEDVTDKLTPDQIDTWDSLNQINLVGALEQEFGVSLVAQDLAEYQSVVKLKALLREHGVEV